ncbi:hypothetical protein GCM10010412_069510 [Nonomuraea recticatena]|uniref:Uncharacterized protein n=1 Tax=Nonomuraea recticatena TaxID=46178 RepID=A0ABN3SRV2_9ACTN
MGVGCRVLVYQHATRDADQRIAEALNARVRAEQKKAGKSRKRKINDG